MINQSLTDAYKYITSENKIYTNNKDRWKFFYESYVGGNDYREAGHLVRYALETNSEYEARCKNTPLDNHCKSVISVYTSFLFREPPKRDFGSLLTEPMLEDFVTDADFEGRSITAFMKEASVWASVFGHSWVLVSKPQINAVTAADQIESGVRPYLNLLSPLTVLDWKWERQPNGRYDLTYLKYIEDVNGSQVTIREWTKDMIFTWVTDEDKAEAQLEAEEVNQMGLIPAVVVYGQRSQVRGIGVSDINDIADQQRSIFNELSEVEQAIRLAGHPSLVVTPDTQLGAGAGALIQIPENMDPGLKPYTLTADATPINMIYDSISNRVAAIDKMANTGGVRATETRSTMSGIALVTERQLLDARLAEKADSLALAEEQIWQLYAMYQGRVWDGYITYPDSFNIRDVTAEFQQLKLAKEVATDPAIATIVDQRLLEILGDDSTDIQE